MSVRLPVIRHLPAFVASLVLTVMLSASVTVVTMSAANAQVGPGQGQYQMPPAYFQGDEDDGDAVDYNASPAESAAAPEIAPETATQAPATESTSPVFADAPTADQGDEDILLDGDYILGVGDKIAVEVYGEEDLSGEFEIDGTGRIFMPLVGAIHVEGKTLLGAQRKIEDTLKPDYLKDPKVRLSVTNFRDYYILGEVNSPGAKPYQSGLTVINAIAHSGGYTGRASKEKITVVRATDPKKEEVRIGLEDFVKPGDILRVKQRLF